MPTLGQIPLGRPEPRFSVPPHQARARIVRDIFVEQAWANSANVGRTRPSMVEFGQAWMRPASRLGTTWSKLHKVGQIGPNSARFRLNSAEFVKLRPSSANFGRARSRFGSVRSKVGRRRPNLECTFPMLSRIGQLGGTSARILVVLSSDFVDARLANGIGDRLAGRIYSSMRCIPISVSGDLAHAGAGRHGCMP